MEMADFSYAVKFDAYQTMISLPIIEFKEVVGWMNRAVGTEKDQRQKF